MHLYVRMFGSQGLVFSAVIDLPISPVFQSINTEYGTRPAQPSSRFLAFILAMAVIASTSSQSLKKVPNNLSCDNGVKQDEGASFMSNDIEDCRNKCEASTKCLAIIFWQLNNHCSIFHNWCEKPGTTRQWVSVEQKPYSTSGEDHPNIYVMHDCCTPPHTHTHTRTHTVCAICLYC